MVHRIRSVGWLLALVVGLFALAREDRPPKETPGKWSGPPRLRPVDASKLKIPTEGKLPAPGVGLFFKSAEVLSLRAKSSRAPGKKEYERLVMLAEAALAQWPADKANLRLKE